MLLAPDLVFDGAAMRRGWRVLVKASESCGGRKACGSGGVRRLELTGTTLIPGLIEGHGHLFLHPYNEASWDVQVLHESLALRTARAVNHARATLLAGFTTERDLGTEGAGYADVGLKSAIEQGVVPGPRLIVATRAIVASGRLRTEGIRARRRSAAGRGRGQRRRHRARGPPADRRRRGRHQALRRLSLAAGRSEPPDIHRSRTARRDRGRA